MVIESLHNHYQSEVAKGNPLYSPQGMELKRIHFVVVITKDGSLVNIEEREGVMNVIRSRQRGGKDACITPNYMWDSLAYVVGLDGTEVNHKSFKELVRTICEQHPDNATFKAVRNFYRQGVEQITTHPLWATISLKKGYNYDLPTCRRR